MRCTCLSNFGRSLVFTTCLRRSFSKLRNGSSAKSNEDEPTLPVGKTVFQTLRGRDLLSFDGYTRNDIFSLLWVAHEMRSKQITGSRLSPFSNTRVGLVWSNPVGKASVSHASQQLGSSLCSFHEDQLGRSSSDFEMLGRSLASALDIIFLDVPSWEQSQVEDFALGSSSPVLVISSKQYAPVLAYSELLTLFLKYGYLRRLVIACIGPGDNPMLNTYFTLLPTVGMHLKYLIHGGTAEYQDAWEKGLQLSSRLNTEMKQVDNLDDVLYRAHSVSTCVHESPYQNLTLKQVKEMDLQWTYVQHDSFKGLSASKDLLREKDHNIIYDVISNQTWIFQALIACHTKDFPPQHLPPRFEGVD